jgi:hypothetical protein
MIESIILWLLAILAAPFFSGVILKVNDKLANAALWILLVTSLTSFFHHFYTMFPHYPQRFPTMGTS